MKIRKRCDIARQGLVWIVFAIHPFHAALDMWEHPNITRWQIMKAQVKLAFTVLVFLGITVDEVRKA